MMWSAEMINQIILAIIKSLIIDNYKSTTENKIKYIIKMIYEKQKCQSFN